MRAFRFFYLLLLLLLLSGELFAQDTTCGIIWDEPILLSDTNYNAHSPRIAISGNETVHATWEGATERLPYSRSTNGGINFIRSDILTDTVQTLYSVWNQVVAESNRVYIFFAEPMPGSKALRMKKSTDAGATWLPIFDATDTVGEIRSTAIVGDTLSIIHSRRGVKYVLRSTDGGQTWARTNEGLNYFARAALSPGGILHLVQMGSDETEYRRSHDLGDTWVQQTLLSPPDGLQSSDPIIAAGTMPGDSTIIAAWRDAKYGCIGWVGCSVIGRSAVSGIDSTTWASEQVLTSIPRGYEPSLSIHNLRIAAGWPMDQNIGQSDPPFAEVRVSHDTSWCSVFDPTSGLATRKVIAVSVALSSKGVHVVWEASQAPDPSTFRIFYRRGRFTTTSAAEEPQGIPLAPLLSQNYPNPFNPSTNIIYRVGSPASSGRRESVSLRVYDILGREVAILVNEKKDVGEHIIEWNAEGMPSGVYYYRLIAGGKVETKKAVLIR